VRESSLRARKLVLGNAQLQILFGEVIATPAAQTLHFLPTFQTSASFFVAALRQRMLHKRGTIIAVLAVASHFKKSI
jgi:hypothetical protein